MISLDVAPPQRGVRSKDRDIVSTRRSNRQEIRPAGGLLVEIEQASQEPAAQRM